MAALWIAIVPVALAHHRRGPAAVDAVVSAVFFFIGVRMRGREMSNR